MAKNKPITETKRFSISVHETVDSTIIKLSKENNLSFSQFTRSLINKGLESHGVKILGNQVVQQ